jgi:hypothetical protein
VAITLNMNTNKLITSVPFYMRKRLERGTPEGVLSSLPEICLGIQPDSQNLLRFSANQRILPKYLPTDLKSWPISMIRWLSD